MKSSQDALYDQKVLTLRDTITEEVFKAIGLKKHNLLRGPVRWMLRPVTTHFARIAERYVRESSEISVSGSALKTLKDFSMKAESRGEENIPKTGPVLVATNHPGALDSLALTSRMLRSDVKIMVSDSAFMREFGGDSPFLIYVDFKTMGGMLALRQAIAHLQQGGLVIAYVHGEVEPDPELNAQGAYDAIAEWSKSIEIMLRKVPETQLELGIMSGAVAQKFMRSPLARLRRKSFERQKAAEFVQVIQQLIAPKTVEILVHLSFAQPFQPDQANAFMPQVIAKARVLLREHLEWIGIKGLDAGSN